MRVRTSLSVVNFKDKIKEVWKLEEWQGHNDTDKDLLFFGLYTKHDYDALYYLPEGVKVNVFWCGSDILNALDNLEWQRILKLYPDAKHYCETEVEAENLKKIGIEAKVVPSFLENEDSFPLAYNHSVDPHVWMCAHPEREIEYGVDMMYAMARKFPTYTFHIYGIFDWNMEEKPRNVLFHGQIPNEQLNKEIRQYQCGFRGNAHEGLSEVIVKALLMGQYCISLMKFPYTWNYQTEEELEKLMEKLKDTKDWNHEGRKSIKGSLNKFPWMGFVHNLKKTVKEL